MISVFQVYLACERQTFLLAHLRRVSRGGTSATQRQKFHTDDVNQCLHNKFGSHKVPNANLFNFKLLLIDFGEVLCSSANELQKNSNATFRKDYIPQILTVLLEIHRVYIQIIVIIICLLLSRHFGNFVCRTTELFSFAEKCLVVNLRLCSPTRKAIWYTVVWTATARKWKKGFQRTHRASCRSGWPRGFGNSIPALTPDYLLPFQWFPVLTPTYSLLLPSEEVFTLHQSMAERVFQSLHHQSLLGWLPACTSNSKLLDGLCLVCSFFGIRLGQMMLHIQQFCTYFQ